MSQSSYLSFCSLICVNIVIYDINVYILVFLSLCHCNVKIKLIPLSGPINGGHSNIPPISQI